MRRKRYGASAVVNIHREGLLLAPTLRSIALAKAEALASGHAVEIVAVLDRPDALTLSVLQPFRPMIDRTEVVDFGDLGAAREHGIRVAAQDWIFMHDGDDLYSSNWYRAFFDQNAAGKLDPRTVWHTHVFARFGDLTDLRTTFDSRDPRFHPLFLAAEWYYSNKAVLHRRLFREVPMPRNRLPQGIGNEDWTWACHSLHAGIRHSFLPETVCFYRVKPMGQSLGLTPGVMQDASPLFDPANVAALTRSRARSLPPLREFSTLAAMKAESVVSETRLPDWFWQEVRVQGAFESLISEFQTMEPASRRMWLPNLSYNVVTAVEYLMLGLDSRPKLFLFASTGTLRAADMTIELFLEAAEAVNRGRMQPVLIVDDTDQAFSEVRLAEAYRAKVISVRYLRDHLRLGDWYFHRLLMRPLMQFPGSTVIDLGSHVFADMFGQFHRTILENQEPVRMIFTERMPDPLNPAYTNLTRNARAWRAHTGQPVPVTVHPGALPLFADVRLWAPLAMDSAAVSALDGITRSRFTAIRRAESLTLEALLALPPPRQPVRPEAGAEGEAARTVQGRIEVTRLRGGAGACLAFRPLDAWVGRDWIDTALAALDAVPGTSIAVPQYTVCRDSAGQQTCREHKFRPPDLGFAALYDLVLCGVQVPLVAVVRLPFDTRADSTAALARTLFRAAVDGAKVTVCDGSIAIARDTLLYPARVES